MDERKRTWLERTSSMLARQYDEIRAAYVGIKMELGADAASRLLGKIGADTKEALELSRNPNFGKAPPPVADEDSFG